MTNKLKGKARAKNSKKQNRLKKIRIESTIRDLQRCILTHDASSLYEPSLDVIIEDDLSFIAKMKKVLAACKSGVGLAGVQIGFNKKVVVLDAKKDGRYKVYINPEIIEHSEETVKDYEGCLSYPKISIPVERYVSVKVKYVSEDFKEHVDNMSNFEARIIQHEIDHISGKCLVGDAWKAKQAKRKTLV